MGSYIPNTGKEQLEMLQSMGYSSMDDLFAAIPDEMKLKDGLNLPEGKSELEVSRIMKGIAAKNKVFSSIFRGAGAYNHYIPAVVGSVLSNESVQTAYTPYQAEISQGLLQSIFEYQTMICDLTGMDASNASVYDGAEAAAEGKELSRIEESKIRAKANVSQSKESEEHVTEAEAAKALGIKHKAFGYSTQELQKKADGEKVFPHVFGTDDQGRDIMVRVMVGTRISIIVGVCAAIIVLIIGALYGSVSGYCGGAVDTVMQRIVEIIYSIPEMLIILLLSATLKPALEQFQNSGDGPMQNLVTILGPNLISMFIAFGLLYWVTMSRIIRGQILQLKQQEYVTAARALGAKGGRIISKHLLPNCIGQIITTTFLQIPSAIFLESFLSFIGVGVSAPLTSLGSMCSEALSGLSTYPYRLFIPAFILSLMILALNLFGDGLRDALDPKLKK